MTRETARQITGGILWGLILCAWIAAFLGTVWLALTGEP